MTAWYSWFCGGAIAILIVLPTLAQAQSAPARPIQPDQVWQQIYQQLPDLPLENQYINLETKKPATDNTLVGRFIRYHLYSRGRSPLYRLDWKISLADYLGINNPPQEADYPSRSTLRQNPLEGDIQAIRKLTRKQREALVQALVDAFTPPSRKASTQQP